MDQMIPLEHLFGWFQSRRPDNLDRIIEVHEEQRLLRLNQAGVLERAVKAMRAEAARADCEDAE